MGRAFHTSHEQQAAPSPLVGEGCGGGYPFNSAEPAPPPGWRARARQPTSPTRGEVTRASRVGFSASRDRLQVLLVFLLAHQLVELTCVGDLELEEPALTFRV